MIATLVRSEVLPARRVETIDDLLTFEQNGRVESPRADAFEELGGDTALAPIVELTRL